MATAGRSGLRLAGAVVVYCSALYGSVDAFVYHFHLGRAPATATASSARLPAFRSAPVRSRGGRGIASGTLSATAAPHPFPLSRHEETLLTISGTDRERRQRHVFGARQGAGSFRRRQRSQLALAESESDPERELRPGRGSVDSAAAFAKPVESVLRFVRRGLPRRAAEASKGVRERMTAWRRRLSLAFIGVAAAVLVMTASAGPAEAFRGIGTKNPDGTPRRVGGIPEQVYQQREALQEFCQSDPDERLFDFQDLSVYEDELNKLDMFSDDVKVSYGAREAMRMKYSGYLEDFAMEGKSRGLSVATRGAAYGSVILVVIYGALASVAWVFKSFLSMAKEEEVHLYGEEISVDATEKEEEEEEEEEPQEDLSVDDEDMEDFAKSGSSSTAGDASTSNPPGAGASGGSVGDSGDEAEDDGDDLLNI